MRDYGDPNSFLGQGFHFPVRVDEVTGRFQMSTYEQDIQEAILIILRTRMGERPMRPRFGCRIYDYAFSTLNYTVISAMSSAVREALLTWEPRIDEIEVHINTQRLNEGIADIEIQYVVRKTNNPYNLVYPFYLNEGLGTGEGM